MAEKELNVIVLAGGESTEREVSLNSAKAVAAALEKNGHKVRILDPGSNASNPVSKEMLELKPGDCDVVFFALHGGYGENGTYQALLDLLKIPYTGSGTGASVIAMNKDASKRIMRTAAIPTADWIKFDKPPKASVENAIDDVATQLEAQPEMLPLIIKPNDGGSTIGLSLVEKPEEIRPAVKTAFDVATSVMVEKYFPGREITISVLDGKALPAVEIKPTHKLYDYACKYTRGKSQYICPADLQPLMAEQFAHDALRLYQTIGCRGYARIDFIMADNGEYVCLELNTLPGMTELSLFPMAARAAGIEFDILLEQLCLMAIEGN